jgi:hypothetical protein
MRYDYDSKLSTADLEFITQVRAYVSGLGLYFNIYINPLVYNGALIAFSPTPHFQKVFDGDRDQALMVSIKSFFEGYARGHTHGSDQGRRGMQSEFRSMLGIEEDDDRVYISR